VSIETTITVETAVAETPRVMQVQGMFDLAPEKTARQSWNVRMPLEEKPWNIGLIVFVITINKASCVWAHSRGE
jgi:hypothetical protein